VRAEVREGEARPEIQVVLPWLIRSRLKREAKEAGARRAAARA